MRCRNVSDARRAQHHESAPTESVESHGDDDAADYPADALDEGDDATSAHPESETAGDSVSDDHTTR